jgi:hypothetical protein
MKLDRIISIATLVALLVAIFLLVKKSAPVAQSPQAPAAGATQSVNAQSANSQSPNQAAEKPEPAVRQVQTQATPASGAGASTATQTGKATTATPAPKAGAGINSEAVSAAISKMLGGSGAGLTPDMNVGEGAPNIKDQKVTYDGDTVHGQFLTEIGGKDVWITISGHMGQKDGYATFDPTEFKVGDMEVPVSLVNPGLQQKLAEERDRLKLSEPAK